MQYLQSLESVVNINLIFILFILISLHYNNASTLYSTPTDSVVKLLADK